VGVGGGVGGWGGLGGGGGGVWVGVGVVKGACLSPGPVVGGGGRRDGGGDGGDGGMKAVWCRWASGGGVEFVLVAAVPGV